MAQKSPKQPESVGKRIADVVDRLAGALDTALRGPAPVPALAPARRPTAEEAARSRRSRARQ